jgi:hypothetical protein
MDSITYDLVIRPHTRRSIRRFGAGADGEGGSPGDNYRDPNGDVIPLLENANRPSDAKAQAAIDPDPDRTSNEYAVDESPE